MGFPHYFQIFGFKLHPHPVMESIAYFSAFQAYLLIRRRERERVVGVEHGLWIVVGAIFGALIGSKVLAWMESPQEFWAMRSNPILMLSGKTIVGGLLGGWVGVEVAKRFMGIRTRTGDACVLPLALGIAIGRAGCFLTGLDDHTYGVATSLPWGVNFGDGIARHPTQLYESIFVLLLATTILLKRAAACRGGHVLSSETLTPSPTNACERDGVNVSSRPASALNEGEEPSRRPSPGLPGEREGASRGIVDERVVNGSSFRWFMLGYLLFRFGIEFIKPTYRPYFGLSAIQLASLAGAFVAAWQLVDAEKTKDELQSPEVEGTNS